jgi:predicted dehydrogenase
MNKQLTAAVIGTGFIGPVHVEALRRIGVPIAGILGSTAAKSTLAAHRLGLPKGYASLDELLDDKQVDVVHITSPNRLHFDQVSAVLAAGKHVMCEKPLAIDSEQSSRLVAMAALSGLVCGINYNIRYYPLCIEAAQRVAAGECGDLFHITGSYVQDWLIYQTDFNWRVRAEEGGNLRAVADIGTHLIDLITFITGKKVAAVCASLQTVFDKRIRPGSEVETYSGKSANDSARHQGPIAQWVDVQTEDSAAVLLKFQSDGKSAPQGSIHVSQVTAGRKNCLRYELAGSRQSLSWNSERPNELQIGHRDRPNEVLIRDPALMSKSAAAFSTYPGGHNEGFPDTFKQLFRDFYDYILTGNFAAKPSFPTFADGHREIEICEAILQSHQSGHWVNLGDSK